MLEELPGGQLGHTQCSTGYLPIPECVARCPRLPGGIQFHLHLPNGPIRWQPVHTVLFQAPHVHRISLDVALMTSDLLVCLGGSDVSRFQLLG